MLDYLATHTDASIRYHTSDMIFHIHSDTSYLSFSNARRRLGGMFFLSNKSPEQNTLHRSILNVTSAIKIVVATAAESEVGACFHNAQSGAPLRVTLTELGHTQPPTPLNQKTPLHFVSWTKQSNRNDQKQWIWGTIGWLTEFAKNKLTFIGSQDVKISANIENGCIPFTGHWAIIQGEPHTVGDCNATVLVLIFCYFSCHF
jgi:hypothetical protein